MSIEALQAVIAAEGGRLTEATSPAPRTMLKSDELFEILREAFGLPKSMLVRYMGVHMQAHDAAEVELRVYVSDAFAAHLTTVVRKYELALRRDEESSPDDVCTD